METCHIEIVNKYLDDYGHVNHAAYLEIFEAARWDYLAKRGFSKDWVKENQQGPVVLEATIKYRKEIMGDEVVKIETKLIKNSKVILMGAEQTMYKADGVTPAATILLLFGMMDLKKRKLMAITGDFAQKMFH